MVKGVRKSDVAKGELLYTEKIPKSLRPRKVLAGKRWSYLENLGRIAVVGLLLFLIYLASTTDLSNSSNVVNIVIGVIALLLMLYVTEVLSPSGRRMSVPIKVYQKGLEVHTSFLEQRRGYPSFISRESITKLIVRRIEVPIEGKQVIMPTNLKLVLSNGKTLDLGRRNYYELENIIKLLEEKFGVPE